MITPKTVDGIIYKVIMIGSLKKHVKEISICAIVCAYSTYYIRNCLLHATI